MKKYKVEVQWMEYYEVEVEAESEQEAYDMAVEASTEISACDCSLYDVNLIELEEEE